MQTKTYSLNKPSRNVFHCNARWVASQFVILFPHTLLRSGSSRCMSDPFVLHFTTLPFRFGYIRAITHGAIGESIAILKPFSSLYFTPIALPSTKLIPPCFTHGWCNPSLVFPFTRFLLLFCSPCGSCLRLVLPSQNQPL